MSRSPRAELRPLRDQPDPVVLRGITLAPKHGVQVSVERVVPAEQPAVAALAGRL